MLARPTIGRILLWAGLGAAALVTLASMAMPRCNCHLRPRANEAAAIATLKNVHAAQQQLLAAAAIDRDGDGHGEAGTFAELAGTAPLRQAADATVAPSTLSTPLLSRAFGTSESGRLHRSGYFFQLFLPAADGTWVARPELADADASERDYRVCAWPDDHDLLRRRAFWLDGTGEVWACGNSGRLYSGHGRPLPPDATWADRAVSGDNEAERMGRDGRRWQLVR